MFSYERKKRFFFGRKKRKGSYGEERKEEKCSFIRKVKRKVSIPNIGN
jgi:hypothetical protein